MSTLSTFKFDEQLTDIIEELKNQTHSASKAEVVRRAITLLKTVQDASEGGEKVILRREDADGHLKTEREIILG
ncbi:MAG: ribbon-helix-helix protein, CopG family [Gammaproteobacteria bacterium]|nr:ribbon-helix-helix protein, CopG family [Gammaproteobacteria bacterium]